MPIPKAYPETSSGTAVAWLSSRSRGSDRVSASPGSTRPLRIAVVGTRGFPDVQGGIETYCANLYPRLVERGCEVTAFTRAAYVPAERTSYRGVRLIRLRCSRDRRIETLDHTFRALLAARKLQPDVVHFHGVGPALLVPMARGLGMRAVIRHVGPDYHRQTWGRLARRYRTRAAGPATGGRRRYR